MIKIAICDDEPHFIERMEKMLRIYEEKSKQSFLIKKYEKPLKLTGAFKEGFQIYFLDLQMPNMNGLELAKAIRETDDRAVIFFVTSYREHVFESFQYDVANYIIKPITQIQIDSEMNRVLRKLNTLGQEYLTVKNDKGYLKIYFSDIQFIETYGRNVLIHCQGGRKEIGHFKMQDLEQQLGASSFIRCHNGYIVNVDYIAGIHELTVTLLSGDVIYTTKTRKKQLIKKLAERMGMV
nr:LytTR family DNA-binding domain-containing protein [uncultured Schaedlerella sp.]